MSDPELFQRIAPDVKLGKRVKIFAFTNLYGCEIGDDTKIGAFPQAYYDKAQKNGWTVISMKNDWRRIFSFETK